MSPAEERVERLSMAFIIVACFGGLVAWAIGVHHADERRYAIIACAQSHAVGDFPTREDYARCSPNP